MPSTTHPIRNKKLSFFLYAIFSIAYFLWYGLVVGLNVGHILFFLMISGLVFSSHITRKLALCFSPFFVYLMFYESLRILHDYNIFPIRNEELYLLEKKIFGVNVDGLRMTLCEYFAEHHHLIPDIISGVFYISWVPIPIAYTLYLFFKKERNIAFDFWICFLIANLFGFMLYIVFPAAPPWYYFKYGAIIDLHAPGEPGALLRFDNLVRMPIYQNMYSAGSNVFGAIPSMHAAFPMMLVYYSTKRINPFLTTLFIASMFSIWFGAIYTSHHYVIDVFLGILCATLAILIVEKLLKKAKTKDYFARAYRFMN